MKGIKTYLKYLLLCYSCCHVYNLTAGITTPALFVLKDERHAYMANNPLPSDRFAAVALTLKELRWKPSRFSVKQIIYFGDKREDVAVGRNVLRDTLLGEVSYYRVPDSLRLSSGKTYYWRVHTDNGSLGREVGNVWSFRTCDSIVNNDITFFVCSEPHYGRSDNVQLNKEMIDLMNRMPGMPLPKGSMGDIVRTPRGVIVNGDLLDNGSASDADYFWNEFVGDYGLTGRDGRLAYPVYEGFGNHDGGPNSLVRSMVKKRNKERVGLTNISSNGLHYSWDWDDLHLVQLNYFGADGPEDVMNVNGKENDPEGALAFLKEDLEKYGGKRAIIFQHIGWVGGMTDWWTPSAKEKFYEVIQPYSVIALFNGHSHGSEIVRWKGKLTIHDGAIVRPEKGDGDFLVVNVTSQGLSIVQRKRDTWGEVYYEQFN